MTDTTLQASRTKEYRATTLIEMGGLLLQKMWFTVWPVIQKPLDAGFALHIFRRNLHLMWFLPAFALYELYEIL